VRARDEEEGALEGVGRGRHVHVLGLVVTELDCGVRVVRDFAQLQVLQEALLLQAPREL
jgi:hypothetical protein